MTDVFAYRLTKYDPQKRDATGAFTGEEWTSISDIGRTFDGSKVTQSEYLHVENRYVESVNMLFGAANITSMKVSDLAQVSAEQAVRLDDAVLEFSRQVAEDQVVSGVDLEKVIRGCLREYIWCRLVGPAGAYLHCGYDFYVYVGLPTSARGLILPRGMFLEELESPYLSLDD